MSTATSADNPRKRVRINEIIDVDNENPPSTTRKMDVNLYTGALASLQPAIRTVADVFFKKLTDLYKLVTSNKDKLAKFNDNDDLIPRSCRSNFQVGASNYVKGSHKFIELQTKIENNNKQFALRNREYIIDVILLEVKATTDALRDTFCECLFKLSRIFLQSSYFDHDIDDIHIHKLSKTIINADASILKYIFGGNTDNFRTYYNKKYNIDIPTHTEPEVITTLLPNGSRNVADYNFNEGEQASYEYAEHNEPGTGLEIILANRRLREVSGSTTTTRLTYTLTDLFKNQYKLLLHRMVNQHWSAMINLHYTKLIDAKLTKLAETLITSDATNDVAMVVAAQPPASEAIISELINQKFNELKKAFKTELMTDKTSKNQQRGENATRASPKKTKSNLPSKKATVKKAQQQPTKKSPKKSPKKQTKTTTRTKEKEKENNEAEGSKRGTTNSNKKSSATKNPTRNGRNKQRTATTQRSKSNPRRGTGKSKTVAGK
jgi:outer membrane biosynthesis protein TonB